MQPRDGEIEREQGEGREGKQDRAGGRNHGETQDRTGGRDYGETQDREGRPDRGEGRDGERGGELEHEILTTVLDRFDLVELLLDEPADKRELTAALPVSRSTVDRAIGDLERLDLVERVDGAYRPTELCRTTAGGLSTLLDDVCRRSRLQEFRKYLPEGSLSLDLDAVSDATVHLAEPANPYALINEHVARIREATDQRLVTPYVGLHAAETARDATVDGDVTSEIVVGSAAADVLRTNPAYRSAVDDMIDTGRAAFFEVEEEIPYFVAVFDDVVQIGVDEDEEPRAIFETTDATVRRWAERRLDAYVERAEPLR